MNLPQKIGQALEQQGLKLVTAESCTGGQVAEVITAISGSSSWFERGFVTYSNEAKIELLGVPQELLAEFGAVSEEVACAMAKGALKNSRADVSIAVTGIAGPTGGTATKPVGTVKFAWAFKEKETKSLSQHFSGDRLAIRTQAVNFALEKLLHFITR